MINQTSIIIALAFALVSTSAFAQLESGPLDTESISNMHMFLNISVFREGLTPQTSTKETNQEFCVSVPLNTLWAQFNHYQTVTLPIDSNISFVGNLQVNNGEWRPAVGKPTLAYLLNASNVHDSKTYPSGISGESALMMGSEIRSHLQIENLLYFATISLDPLEKVCSN